MTQTSIPSPSLLRLTGLPYFVIAFIARLPFAMMVVGVLTMVVTVRGSLRTTRGKLKVRFSLSQPATVRFSIAKRGSRRTLSAPAIS